MFWGLAKDASQFFNHMKFAMGIVIFHAYTHLMVPILGYPFEIKLVKKEHFNQWYSIGPYFMALTIVKIPTMVALSVVFSCIVYFSSGLPLEMVRLIAFCFSNVLIAFIADSLGLTIGSIFSVTNGAAIGPMSLAPLLGFAIYGFDFAKRISTVWRTVMRTSFLRSAVVANVLVMFGMGRSELECYDPMYCHFKDPMTTLRYLDIDQVSLALEIMWMIVFFVTFRLAFFFALVFRFWLH
ncbi:hypothetical protein AAG570_013671 [Ranatra chinensis]|uniref:ABC-2 type transporter transmembrane domain-containing protein n=1 Tax=Ranatra chinensis TaxID=642074 RepID=A0ABD0YCV7_9HEMI